MRRRVVERLERAPVAFMEAPGGYGKTTACAQLAAALDVVAARVVLRDHVDTAGLLSSLAVATRRAGLAALSDAIAPEEPEATLDQLIARLLARRQGLLLVVDEVQRSDASAGAWLAALADDLPADVHLVIAGRRLGSELARMAGRPGVASLGVEDMRFDADEVAAVLASARDGAVAPADVAAVLTATDGWPAAVSLAAVTGAAWSPGVHAAREGGARPAAGIERVLRDLVDELLAAADQGTRALVAAIAELPLLSAEVLAAVGGDGALDLLLDAGLPIRFRSDGWGELPDPVRELFPDSTLAPTAARAVAAIYARRGDLAEAAALLHRRSDHQGVMALLAGQRREALARAGLPLLHDLVAALPDAVLAGASEALVNLVRAAERQPRLRRMLLERAARVLAGDAAAMRAIAAEQAIDAAWADDLIGPVRIAEDVLAAASSTELVTRGRAHVARARCLLLRDTAGATDVVAADLQQAAVLFRLAGEPRWEAYAHQALGYGCDFTTGAYERAAQRLEQALALRSAPDADRANTLTFLAEVLTHAGRLGDAEVAVREAATIGHRLGDSVTIAYAAWSEAELACQRRDRAATSAALAEAERHPAGWFDGLAGIDFLSNATEIRTQLGDVEGARRDLDRALARAAGTSREDATLTAQARFETTFGDPGVAVRLLDVLDHNPLAYQRDRWLRLLLRAVCAARTGDADAAAALLALARGAAAHQGDPSRPDRWDPELVALAAPDQQATASRRGAAKVVLLGDFGVERDGVAASPPPGRTATLVKLLALRTRLSTDEAIDLLWPEADLDAGRGRLRNLLTRVKATCGPIVVRTENGLRLAEGVEVDAIRFEQDTAAALGAPSEERAGLARSALARYTGELLPADRYADWATAARERLRRHHLALLDVVADDAISHGELDEACRLLDVAIGADPLEEQRYVRLAGALLAQGRPRRARGVVERGVHVAAELGVEPGDGLRALREQLLGR